MKLRSIRKIFLLILVPMVFILLAQDRSAGNGEQSQPSGEIAQAAGFSGNEQLTLIAFPGQDVFGLAIDPVNPAIVYVSVYFREEQNYRLFKSEDGGVSWKSFQGDLPKKHAFSLILDPHHPSTFFAGGHNKLFKSEDRGDTWREIQGIMMGFKNIAVDPITPGVLYAGCWDGIYKSRDNGENWRCIYKDPNFNNYHGFRLDFYPVRIHPFIHCLVAVGSYYMLFGGSQDEYYWYGYMETKDCGDHWADCNRESNWAEWDYIDPTNSDLIYSFESGRYDKERGLWRSLDGGKTWSLMSQDLNEISTHRPLVMDPNSPSHLFVGSYQGLYVSSDEGLSWSYCGLENVWINRLGFAGKTSRLYVATSRGLYIVGQPPNDNFPVIDIVQPQNQQMVCGIVPIQVEAKDDQSVARVEFFVNDMKLDERLCSGKSVSLSFDWDTRSFAIGDYEIFVNAYDDEERQSGRSIRVALRQVGLNLLCQKVVDRGWSAKKRYVILTTDVQNPCHTAVAKYVLYRWKLDSNWGGTTGEIKVFTDADLVDGKLTWKEPITRATPMYEYKIKAFNAAGTLLGQSNSVTVTGD